MSALYAAARFDRCFHVPNSSKGPGDYSNGAAKGVGRSVNTEADVFGAEDSSDKTVINENSTEKEWEARFKREQESGLAKTVW